MSIFTVVWYMECLGFQKHFAYTPIFAAARIVGWSAHRLEELKNVDKMIRPASTVVSTHRDYIRIHDR